MTTAVPFRTFAWQGDELLLGSDQPDPELRQTDDTSFVILESFCYSVPPGDPEEGAVYVVPGADEPLDPATRHRKTVANGGSQHDVVLPPSTGGGTDLASVPSFMWWLIASYGNHTRAALLHDSLYVDEGEPPVPRATADRLFLTALREPGQKKGVFRHWLMWAAVSAFGNMRRSLGILFAAHVLAVWGLVIAAVGWAWGPSLWHMSWSWWEIVLAVVAAPLFLAVLGTSWRAGVDLTGGWLSPTLLLAALVVVPLALQWPSPFELDLTPFTLLLVAAVLLVLGLFWGAVVDPRLRMWLWPTALIGLPIAMIPVGLIVLAIRLVWFIDLGAAIAAAQRTDQYGNPRGFEVPKVDPRRLSM